MGELEERILLMDRIRMLEKATAVAYLDANLSGERYAHEAQQSAGARPEPLVGVSDGAVRRRPDREHA